MNVKNKVRRPVNTSLQSSVIVYLVLMMFGLPLILTDGYFNITETKSVYFYVVSIGLIIFTAFFTGKKSTDKSEPLPQTPLLQSLKLSVTDKAMLIFCLFCLISSLLSPYRDSWIGVSSRYQGFMTVLVYTIVYFIVSRNFTAGQSFLLFSVLAFSAVSIIGVINCFDIDIFNTYKGIDSDYKKMFISTIGNINFYSSYMCLLLPLVVSGFCLSQGKISRTVYTTALVVGSFGMMVTSSESFVVGFASSLMIMPLFFYSRLHRFKRYLLSIIIIVLSSQAYMIIYRLHGSANVEISKLLSVFVNPFVAIFIILLCLVSYAFAVKAPEKMKIARKIYPVLLVAFVVTVIICFLLANTVGISSLDKFFKITSEWGTYRGKIWRYCIKTYLYEYSFKEKLFGTGLETLSKVTAGAALFERKNLDQAHNEYLQYLMTTGAFGLITYLSVIGSTIYTVIKKLRSSTFAVALLTGLISYWMQATVNIAQPFTTPIVYIYIACIAGMAKLATESSRQK